MRHSIIESMTREELLQKKAPILHIVTSQKEWYEKVEAVSSAITRIGVPCVTMHTELDSITFVHCDTYQQIAKVKLDESKSLIKRN